MSELDTSLRALRDELNAAIPLPDVEHVTGRARTRRRLQLGAVAAVVAVALAVPVLRSLPADPSAATPPDAPKTNYIVDFSDPDHGYALGSSCVDKKTCSYTFHRTEDGGRDWQRMTLPAATDYSAANLYVLGPDEVVIDRPMADPTEIQRSRSTDGGRSWQVVENPWQNGNTSLGPASLLVSMCGMPALPREACGGLHTIRPDSGKTVAIPSQPPMSAVSEVGPVATEDGKWWVTHFDFDTDRWFMSVSADGGRSWSTSDMNLVDTALAESWAVTERYGIMYATVIDRAGLLGVWHSTDAGKSWTRAWTVAGDHPVPGVLSTPIATSDGNLVLTDGLTNYVSTDLGRTFTRTGEKVAGTVRWTRAGYLRTDGYKRPLTSDGNTFALSTDGLHWREFTVG